MSCPTRPCETHQEIVGFRYPLSHFADALKSRRKVKVVAIGSSSTAGADGVLPFPPRLEMLLREKFPGRMIDVLNRGIGGQEAPEELSRFESDVIAEAPALVIWQVGTNAVYHDTSYYRPDVATAIAVGLNWLAGLPMDVVLMDLQYTTAMVCKVEPSTVAKLPFSEDMESLIAAVGDNADPKVNIFRRFALMRRWYDDGVSLQELTDNGQEQLHTSEWAADCVAHSLCEAIVGAPVTGAIR